MGNMCITKNLLDKLGVEYLVYEEPARPVAKAEVKFGDILPSICTGTKAPKFCGFEMYKHQKEALERLMAGKSVIVTASTGGGKTEIWVSYALSKQALNKNFGVLVIYPTKALAADQIARIKQYYLEAGYNIVEEERKTSKGVVKFLRGAVLRYDGDVSNYVKEHHVKQALVTLINPEILLDVLEKRMGGSVALEIRKTHKLWAFILKVKLIVIDELDFYGSTRSTLLLYLVRRLIEILGLNTQVVILGATLSNIEAIKSLLPLNFEVVGGEANRPANYLYVVLGRKESVWSIYGKLHGAKNKEEFREKFFDILVGAGQKHLDDLIIILRENEDVIEDLLKMYLQCPETTLVFTRSIKDAERLGGKLDNSLVAVHHSKVPKERRAWIEERARLGEIKVLITVKTLLQGIDIGHIARVIHVGLPDTLKELIQREGRKGRREDITMTETVIVPIRIEDAVLISEGLKSLNLWRALSLETLLLNPDNDLLKIYDHYLNFKPLSQAELELIGWPGERKLEFYQMFHTDNIPIFVYDPVRGEFQQEESCTLKEFIEDYQPGSINVKSEPTLVVSTYDSANKQPAVLEIALREDYLKREGISGILNQEYLCEGCSRGFVRRSWRVSRFVQNALLKAVEEYEKWCYTWNQIPNFYQDVEKRKLISEVCTTVVFSGVGGFKLVKEYPALVRWHLESRERKLKILPDGTQTYAYERVVIKVLENPRAFPYKFFTYAYVSDVDPRDVDFDKIAMGMGFLLAVLRYKYGIQPDLLGYFLEGQSRLLKIWEKEPIGLLKTLRSGGRVKIDKEREFGCQDLLEDVRNIPIDEKLKIMLRYVDSLRFTHDVLADKAEMEKVRQMAERLVYYLCNMISVKLSEELKYVHKTPQEPILIVDSLFNKIAVILSRPEAEAAVVSIIEKDEGRWIEALGKKIFEISNNYEDLTRLVHIGLSGVEKAVSRIRIDVVDLSKFLAQYPEPVSLGRIWEELTGSTDLVELQNDISTKIREGKTEVLERLMEELFKKRAGAIIALYNLFKRAEVTPASTDR